MKILDNLWGKAFSLWTVNAEAFVEYLDLPKQYYSNTGFCVIPLTNRLRQQNEIFIKLCSLSFNCSVDNIFCELLYSNLQFYIKVNSNIDDTYEIFNVALKEGEMIFLKKFLSSNQLWQKILTEPKTVR